MPNCTRCGADNDSSANFCRNCGNPMTAQSYVPPPPPPAGQGVPPPPPGYYPPPPGYGQPAESGMPQNIAGLIVLCARLAVRTDFPVYRHNVRLFGFMQCSRLSYLAEFTSCIWF